MRSNTKLVDDPVSNPWKGDPWHMAVWPKASGSSSFSMHDQEGPVTSEGAPPLERKLYIRTAEKDNPRGLRIQHPETARRGSCNRIERGPDA